MVKNIYMYIIKMEALTECLWKYQSINLLTFYDNYKSHK